MHTLCGTEGGSLRIKEGTHVAPLAGGLPEGGAHVGNQQEVRQMSADRGAGLRVWRSGAWNGTVDNEGRSGFGGDARTKVVARDRSTEKNTKKETHSQEELMETSFFPTSETPKNTLRRCLARSIIVGHTQKTMKTRAAETANLKLACPKTLSKVHAVGARDLCPPQHQEKKPTKRQHGVDATGKRRPRKHTYVTRYATLPNVEREPWRATHVENKTTTAPSPT